MIVLNTKPFVVVVDGTLVVPTVHTELSPSQVKKVANLFDDGTLVEVKEETKRKPKE